MRPAELLGNAIHQLQELVLQYAEARSYPKCLANPFICCILADPSQITDNR